MNTTYFRNLVAGNVFNTKTTPAIPSNYYIGLSSTAPNASGGNVTEPSTSGTGYERVQLNNLTTPSGGSVTNSSALSFPASTAEWFSSGTPATYYVIYDAATGGNLLMYGQLLTPRVIGTETIVTIAANSLYLMVVE